MSSDGQELFVATNNHLISRDIKTGRTSVIDRSRDPLVHANRILAPIPGTHQFLSQNVFVSPDAYGQAMQAYCSPHDVNEIHSVAVSPNGKTIAFSSRNGLHLWDVESRQQTTLGKSDEDAPSSSMAFSPDGKTLAIERNGIRFIDVDKASVSRRVPTPLHHGNAFLSFTCDGHRLVISNIRGEVAMLEVESGMLVPQGLHSNSQGLVLLSSEGFGLALWNGNEWLSAEDYTPFPFPLASLYCGSLASPLILSPDGRYVTATVYSHRHIATFDLFSIHDPALRTVDFTQHGSEDRLATYRNVISSSQHRHHSENTRFGASVAVGDKSWVIGHPGQHNGKGEIFAVLNDPTHIGNQLVIPEAVVADDGFGECVACDSSTLAVAAVRQLGSGLIDIFQITDEQTLRFKTELTVNRPGLHLGHSMQIQNDILVAGTDIQDRQHPDFPGKVFVFKRDESQTWRLAQELKLPPEYFSDPPFIRFGSRVRFDGDTLVIRAESRSGNRSDSVEGELFIYGATDAARTDWRLKQVLRPAEGQMEMGFASDFSLSGSRLAVGIPGKRSANGHRGCVALFERQSDGVWRVADTVWNPNVHIGDNFGGKLSLRQNRLVVLSAFFHRDQNEFGSTGLVFERSQDRWQRVADLHVYNQHAFAGVAVDQCHNFVAIGCPLDVFPTYLCGSAFGWLMPERLEPIVDEKIDSRIEYSVQDLSPRTRDAATPRDEWSLPSFETRNASVVTPTVAAKRSAEKLPTAPWTATWYIAEDRPWHLTFLENDEVLSLMESGNHRIWRMGPSILQHTISSPRGKIRAYAASPDGNTLWVATEGWGIEEVRLHPTIQWQTLSRLEVGECDIAYLPATDSLVYRGVGKPPMSIRRTGDPRVVAFAEDIATESRIFIGARADGSEFALSDGKTVHQFDAKTLKEKRRISFENGIFEPAVWSMDGELLAIADGNDICIVQNASGRLLRRLKGHKRTVDSLRFLPNEHLASMGQDRTIRLWDPIAGNCTAVLRACLLID